MTAHSKGGEQKTKLSLRKLLPNDRNADDCRPGGEQEHDRRSRFARHLEGFGGARVSGGALKHRDKTDGDDGTEI